MLIVTAVDQKSITQTCGVIVALCARRVSRPISIWFRNALQSGDCMNMLLSASAKLSSSVENRSKCLPSAMAGRVTSRATSGATIAETAGTSAT